MHTITHDERSFFIDGKRQWIMAGETHYFRLPRAEWPDALLRAKRAGLNTVCTYVPWNFHEPVEGRFCLDGDADLAAYLDLAGEMGLYVMIRPGPYICSEWDGGGIPGWLCAKGVRRFREDDPAYMAAVTRWFDRLLPLIATRQITRGGPVITIQNENEYPGGWDASMRRYIDKLSALFHRHGIDVPILACNVHGMDQTRCKINDATEPADQIRREDMILTYNHHVVVEPLLDLRRIQPDAPSIVTEFWTGPPLNWGTRVEDGDGAWPSVADQGRAAYAFLANGAQLCCYMFEGGTNFGFWAGCNIATSYAACYPVGDGGVLQAKYYGLHPALLFAGQFGDFLAESRQAADGLGLTVCARARVTVRSTDAGAMAFVYARDDQREAVVTLPDGRSMTVWWGAVPASALPFGLTLPEGATLDYSNLCLLARQGKTVVLFGQAGTEGIISVNGEEMRLCVPRGVAHRVIRGTHLLVCDEAMAQRTWLLDSGRMLFGPAFAGREGSQGAAIRLQADSTAVYAWDGERFTQPLEAASARTTAALMAAGEEKPPGLEGWRMLPCPEMDDTDAEGWTPLDAPTSHEALGEPMGYVWYRAAWESDTDGDTRLLLPNTPNRVGVYVNGRFWGVHAAGRCVRMRDEYGHPADWAFEAVPIRVRKGRNELVFLSDNQGHNYDVPIPVGIQGPVYAGARMVEPARGGRTAPLPVSGDAFTFLYNRFYRAPAPLPAVEYTLDLAPGEEAFVVIHGVQAWITVDGQDVLPMSYPESPWTMFAQIKRWITWRLPEGARVMRVQQVGTAHEAEEHMAVYAVPKHGALGDWRWKPWSPPAQPGGKAVLPGEGRDERPPLLLPVEGYMRRKGRTLQPAWLRADFAMPPGDRPVYLDIGEMQKGQIYLNGHNAGRFWAHADTQRRYYLPRAWMREENELLLFEELGLYPQGARLVLGDRPRITERA